MTEIAKLIRLVIQFEDLIRPIRDNAGIASERGGHIDEGDFLNSRGRLSPAKELLREIEGFTARSSFCENAALIVAIRKLGRDLSDVDGFWGKDSSCSAIRDGLTELIDSCVEVLAVLGKAEPQRIISGNHAYRNNNIEQDSNVLPGMNQFYELLNLLDLLYVETEKFWDVMDRCSEEVSAASDEDLLMLPEMGELLQKIESVVLSDSLMQERDVRNQCSKLKWKFEYMMQYVKERPLEPSVEMSEAFNDYLRSVYDFRSLLDRKVGAGPVWSMLLFDLELHVRSLLEAKGKSEDSDWAVACGEVMAEDKLVKEILGELENCVRTGGGNSDNPLRKATLSIRRAFDEYQGVVKVENKLLGAESKVFAVKMLDEIMKAQALAEKQPEEPPAADSTLSEIDRVCVLAEKVVLDAYNSDIKESLNELNRCFSAKCLIACMCLCGRMMEAALKMRFSLLPAELQGNVYADFKRAYPEIWNKGLDDLGLGELIALSKVAGQGCIGRLPEGLANDADKIKRFRNSYIHAKDKGESPIPSENDTRSVIHTLAEVLDRTYEHVGQQGPCASSEG